MAAARFEPMARGQSERLVPMIQEVMAEAGQAYEDLDAIAVTRGPGGFTGVRIGLATARGLALASGRPVIGLTSFEAVAAALDPAARRGRPLAVLIDAKRREVYLQVFDADSAPLDAPRAVDPDDLAAALPPGPLLLAGDGLGALGPVTAEQELSAVRHADAARFLPIAATLPLPPAGAAAPQPLYLRAPDVTLPGRPRPGGRGPR